MANKDEIRNIIELFIAWNGETEPIDVANIDSAVEFIGSSLQAKPKFKTGDRIKPVDSCLGSSRTIVDVCDSWYVTNQGTLDFEFEDNWELVEEPVSELWHDASEKPKPNMELICVGQYGNPLVLSSNSDSLKSRDISKWAYFNDILNLSNVERTVKVLQEEPVSEDLEEVSKKYALNNTPWDDCADEMQEAFKAGAKWQKTKEEPVSEDLEEAAKRYAKEEYSRKNPSTLPDRCIGCYAPIMYAFRNGAKWQKNHLWKPADGDDLPEIDREVIALLDNGKVVFAHRPPEYWDGKDIVTGKVTRNYPKTYDKGGWNIPDVKYWLDCSMLKEIEL